MNKYPIAAAVVVSGTAFSYFMCTKPVKANVKANFKDTYNHFVLGGPKPEKISDSLDGIYNNHSNDPQIRQKVLEHSMANKDSLRYFKITKEDILKYPEVLNVSEHSFTTRKNAVDSLTENQIKEYISPICSYQYFCDERVFKDRELSDSFEDFMRCKYPPRREPNYY